MAWHMENGWRCYMSTGSHHIDALRWILGPGTAFVTMTNQIIKLEAEDTLIE